ncbi:MAG: hypothetical protein ACFFCS_22690 [Candidatus Hodarchaeota archaeon]
MKILYSDPKGDIELSAFINAETGAPTFFLTLFGKTMPFSFQHIEALREYIPYQIEHDTSIIEATKSTGYFKDIKKGISVIIKDSMDSNVISDKKAWPIFKTYVLKLLEFLRSIYNSMTPEQRNMPDMVKLHRVLQDINL